MADVEELLDTVLNVPLGRYEGQFYCQSPEELVALIGGDHCIYVDMDDAAWIRFVNPDYTNGRVSASCADFYREKLLEARQGFEDIYRRYGMSMGFLKYASCAYRNTHTIVEGSVWALADVLYGGEVPPSFFDDHMAVDASRAKPSLSAVLKKFALDGTAVDSVALDVCLKHGDERVTVYLVFRRQAS